MLKQNLWWVMWLQGVLRDSCVGFYLPKINEVVLARFFGIFNLRGSAWLK
jgi:hypothetical protein